MKNLILVSLFIMATSCANSQTQVPAPVETAPIAVPVKATSCTCIKMWMPVCGENKKTYGNSCEADCAGVKYTQGQCKKTPTK